MSCCCLYLPREQGERVGGNKRALLCLGFGSCLLFSFSQPLLVIQPSSIHPSITPIHPLFFQSFIQSFIAAFVAPQELKSSKPCPAVSFPALSIPFLFVCLPACIHSLPWLSFPEIYLYISQSDSTLEVLATLCFIAFFVAIRRLLYSQQRK